MQFLQFIEPIMLLLSIVSFIRMIFRRDKIYLGLGVSALGMFFAIKCLFNDQFVLGGGLCIAVFSLMMLCDYDMKKRRSY